MSNTLHNENTAASHCASKERSGAEKMEAFSKHMTNLSRFLLLFSIFLVAYAFTLGEILISVYEPYATASFEHHSLLATVNVLQAAISVATMPTAAKFADVFGRMALVIVSVIPYTLGTAIQASSSNLVSFAIGAVFYYVGFMSIIMAITIIIADTTSLRSRLFCSFIIAFPHLINTWVAGNISSAMLDTTSWRWGIGMWSIIYPVSVIPLVSCLYAGHRRTANATQDAPASANGVLNIAAIPRLLTALFWQFDIIGIFLIVTALALILVPLSLAGSGIARWGSAAIITPLIFGVLIIPVWITWERRCGIPMVPPKLLKDRAIWAAFVLGVIFNASFAMQNTFLYSFLVIAIEEPALSATRISALYKFCVIVVGTLISIVVWFKLRRLKRLIILGNFLSMASFGVLVYTRGSLSGSSHANIIASQVFLGIAGAMYTYPIQVNVQAAACREHVAVITSLFFSCNFVGGALGSAVVGAIWNIVLRSRLAFTLGDDDAAQSVFADPFTYIGSYSPGSPQRNAVSESYAYTQKIICLVGLGFCLVQTLFSFAIRDPELGKEQSLSSADSQCQHELERMG